MWLRFSFCSCLLGLLGFVASAHAQEDKTCDVTIVLKEKGTKSILAQSNIYLMPDGIKQTTNEKGQATFDATPCGDLTWVINVAGYKRLDLKKFVEKDERIAAFLEPVDQAQYQTIVTDNENKRDGSRRVVDQEDFIKAVGSRGDPLIALENEPGFSSFGNQGGVILQGADPEDTRLYVNGHEVPLIFHSLGFSSIFIPDVIDSVELMTAGFGSEYGRTTAGNINLTTRTPKSDRIHAMAYVDLLNSAAVIQGPIDKAKKHTFWAGGRVSYIGPIFNLVTSEDDNVSFNQVPQFFDLQGNYQWEINNRWTFDILSFGAQDQLRLRIKDNEDPLVRGDFAFRTAFYRVIPRIRYDDGDKNKFDFSVGLGRDWIDQEFDDFFFDAKIFAPTFRGAWTHKWTDQFETVVGLDTIYTDFDANLRVPAGTFPNSEDNSVPENLRDVISKDIREKYWDWGGYLRFNIRDKQDKWLFSPNARVDYSDLTEQFHVSPRLAITRRLSEQWRLRAATGLYYQTPQPPELEVDFGNPELNDVRSIHYALSALVDTRQNTNQGFWGDVTVFYKDLDNVIIDTNNTVVRDGVTVPERFSNEGDGYAVGSQWALQMQRGRFSGGIAYTLLWSRRKEPGTGYFPTDFEQRHNFNVRARYRLGNWELSSRLRLISGVPDTPVTGAFYDLDNDIYVPVNGEINSDNIPMFVQWDVRVDRKWVYKRWIMSLYVDVLNVTNRTNGNEFEYNFDYTDRDLVGGIPILPTFGIKGEF